MLLKSEARKANKRINGMSKLMNVSIVWAGKLLMSLALVARYAELNTTLFAKPAHSIGFTEHRRFRDSAIIVFAVNSRNRPRFAEAPNNSRKNADFSLYILSSSYDSGDAIKYRRTHRL